MYREKVWKPVYRSWKVPVAAEHDKELYNELSKLVVKSTTGYMFRKQGYSPYFSANLNVSKEIGKYLTVSFFANNFLLQHAEDKELADG